MAGTFALLNLVIIAGTTLTAQQSSSVPNCAVGNAPGQAYVDETLDQLKMNVPSLRGIRPEATQSQNATAGVATAQDQADSILGHAGTTLAELRHRIPNLIAKEEVIQEIQGGIDSADKQSYSALSPLMAPPSMGPSMGLQGSPSTSNRTRVYGYRIAPRADSTFGDAFDEFRTDSHNHRIADATDDPHTPHTMGFATSWLIFLPKNQKESRFRYLGQQRIGSHQTDVLAFAQIPGVTHLDTVVGPASGRCVTYVQGVVWIDQSTYRIVRLQIDLLSPVPGIQLNKLRSILNYGEAKIRKRNLPLWLPADVETSWQIGGVTGNEAHRYSNYKLFGATTTILPASANPTH
jgi:hypothetical protein